MGKIWVRFWVRFWSKIWSKIWSKPNTKIGIPKKGKELDPARLYVTSVTGRSQAFLRPDHPRDTILYLMSFPLLLKLKISFCESWVRIWVWKVGSMNLKYRKRVKVFKSIML